MSQPKAAVSKLGPGSALPHPPETIVDSKRALVSAIHHLEHYFQIRERGYQTRIAELMERNTPDWQGLKRQVDQLRKDNESLEMQVEYYLHLLATSRRALKLALKKKAPRRARKKK